MRADTYGYSQCVTAVSSFKEISRRMFGMAEKRHVNNIFNSIVLQLISYVQESKEDARSGIQTRVTEGSLKVSERSIIHTHVRLTFLNISALGFQMSNPGWCC